MTTYKELRKDLRRAPKRWLITGVAGFIDSNLLEELLQLDQQPIELDNFPTGNVLHSQAKISKASHLQGYAPTHSAEEGLEAAMGWYIKKLPHKKRTDTQC